MAQEKPLVASVVFLALPLGLLPVLKWVEINDEFIGPLSATTVGILELSWLRNRENKQAQETKAVEAKEGKLKANALPLIVALGVVAAGLVTLVQFVISLAVSRPIDLGRELGFIALTGQNESVWTSDIQTFLILLWFPISALLAIPLAKYAAHRLGPPALRKMLGSIAVAALIVVCVNIPFTLSVAAARSLDPMSLIASSLPNWLREAALVALALLIAFSIGGQLASRTQTRFLVGRLVATASASQRRQVLDVFGEQPDVATSPISRDQDAPPDSAGGPEDTSAPGVNPEQRTY